MPKNIQIPEDLFIDLCDFFLRDQSDDQTLDDQTLTADIKAALNIKLDKIINHKLFSRYKTAPSGADRELARKAYLDKRGVPDSFRTDTEVEV